MYWAEVSFIRPHHVFDTIRYICAGRKKAFCDILLVYGVRVEFFGRGSRAWDDWGPLTVIATCNLPDRFRDGVVEFLAHLQSVTDRYREFCRTNGMPMLEPGLHLFGFCDWSRSSHDIIEDLTIQYVAPRFVPQLAVFHGAAHKDLCDQQKAQAEEPGDTNLANYEP